jgi:hypothetical protein
VQVQQLPPAETKEKTGGRKEINDLTVGHFVLA